MKKYSRARLHLFARVFGNTKYGLTGYEIEHLLKDCQIKDTAPTIAKWMRLFYAFTEHSDRTNDDSEITKFIEKAMDPNRYLDDQPRYEKMRENLDKVLLLEGSAISKGGKIISTKNARLLRDTEERARAFRTKLESRGVHRDVLEFCGAELAEYNYFHAVLEAAKSISYKLRELTGLQDDGVDLANRALGTKSDNPKSDNSPMVTINPFETISDKSEQRGFLYLVKGIFSMFRNRVAHDARTQSKMGKDDLEDLLLLASIIHRRLDKATITRRTKTK